jgi:putative transposase
VIDRIYCHIVWTTRNREALIDDSLARFLCRFFRGIASQEAARILEIGMVRTHVHLLARIHPTTDISRLMQRLKGGSAAIAGKERRSLEGGRLRWAKGYSIHSVSFRSVADVRAYLRTQPTRHSDQVITGWEGDSPEYEGPGTDEWRSEGRKRI